MSTSRLFVAGAAVVSLALLLGIWPGRSAADTTSTVAAGSKAGDQFTDYDGHSSQLDGVNVSTGAIRSKYSGGAGGTNGVGGGIGTLDATLGSIAASAAGSATGNEAGYGDGSGTGAAHVFDTLTFTSTTLAPGTPVDVEFCLATARRGDAIHSAPTNELGTGNFAGGNLELNFQAYDPNTFVSFFKDSYTYAVGTDGTFEAQGTWAGSSGQQSIVFHPTIGESIAFSIALNAYGSAAAQPTLDPLTGDLKSTSGTAAFCGSAIYGMDAQTPGVNIVSELTGAFPSCGGVGTDTAVSYVPDNPLPEPATAALLVLGAMVVVRRKHTVRVA